MSQAANALLLTAPGCPHCPGVKTALEGLLQEGLLADLEVVDISQQPDKAAELGVRSVPWLQLGEFVLTGAQTPQQLREWAQKAAGEQDMGAFLHHLLANGELAEAEALLRREPRHLDALLKLMEAPERPMQVALGVSAILEGMAGQAELNVLLPALIRLSRHPEHQLRSDACHYLGLLDHPGATVALKDCLNDSHADVREIAAEALQNGSNQGL